MIEAFRAQRVWRATKADQAIGRVPSRRAKIVTQHPAKAFVADKFTLGATDFFARIDDSVLQPLVMSRRMIMDNVLTDSMPQHLLAEKDHLGKVFVLQASEKPLKMGVQIRRSRRQLDAVDTFVLKEVTKARAERAIPVHDQITSVIKEAVFKVRQIPDDLPHPRLIRIRCTAGEMDTPCSHLHHEEQIVGHQAALGPYFNGSEVDCRQDVPV